MRETLWDFIKCLTLISGDGAVHSVVVLMTVHVHVIYALFKCLYEDYMIRWFPTLGFHQAMLEIAVRDLRST